MNISNNTVQSSLFSASRRAARQLQPTSNQQLTNPIFSKNAFILGEKSPCQAYTVSSANIGSSRDNILNSISQARVLASAFTTEPLAKTKATEPFSIRDYYNVSPNEVVTILSQLREEVNNADYSGMSTAETYERIENRFKETFGEDFMTGYNLLLLVPGNNNDINEVRPVTNYEYVNIGIAFNNILTGKIGWEERTMIHRTNQYGDMNDGEILDTIIAKYPQPLTNRDLALITSELHACGINPDNSCFGVYVEELVAGANEKAWDDNWPSWEEFEQRWNALLNERADIQHMAYLHNKNISYPRNEPHHLPFIAQTTKILEKLGAKLGLDGLFLQSENRVYSDINARLTNRNEPDDLIDELLENLERHDKTLRESRA